MNRDIADIRRDYQLASLDEATSMEHPMDQFTTWWNDAIESNIDEVNAFVLSTVKANGAPASRVVLLKGYTPEGFVFFTNYASAKGLQVETHPHVAMNFFWKELERQIRIEGTVEKVSAEESDRYFNSRPASSRIGAWASPQSAVIENRTVIEQNVERYSSIFANDSIERPDHWGGYIVKPTSIEFWQGRSSRLHDRIRYKLETSGYNAATDTRTDANWKIERLAP